MRMFSRCCRVGSGMAMAGEKGFLWKEGLLFLTVTENIFQELEVLVVPKGFRAHLLKAAHDGVAIGRSYSC